MNKVFIVTQGSYSDLRNIGVFTSREKAEAAGGDIEEWILDNQAGAPGHYQWFFIVMDREGNVRRSQVGDYLGNPSAPRFAQKYPKGNSLDEGCCYFSEWGTDLTHAVKVANEKRVQMIANHQWPV